MDSKDELRKPLSRQPLAIRKDNLGRPLSIPEDKLDVLLKLPVDWTQTYKKFAVTVCLQYPLAIGFCMLVFLSGEDEIFKTLSFVVSHGKFVAIGYAMLVLFASLSSLLLFKEQTQMYFQFWQERRDLNNIKIVYRESCRYWFKLQFQTQVCISLSLYAILYPVTLAFDERLLNLLTCDNQLP